MIDGLFDTNIVIDVLNGFARATSLVLAAKGRAISLVTWMEVLAGTDPKDEPDTRAFLLTFTVIPISDAIAERAAAIRRTSRLKLLDAIILATAEIENLTLITRNTRDFDPNHPSVHVPYVI